jgi:hypothetical protein
MARYFTLEQAQRLLPIVDADLRQAVRLREDLESAAGDLEGYSQRLAMAGGALVDQKKLLGLRGRRDALASRLKETIESIQSHGCQIKDLEMGLLDFPTMFRGEEVLLCWKLGEPEIAFWHGTEEGFRGRKKIDADFLANHSGE